MPSGKRRLYIQKTKLTERKNARVGRLFGRSGPGGTTAKTPVNRESYATQGQQLIPHNKYKRGVGVGGLRERGKETVQKQPSQ